MINYSPRKITFIMSESPTSETQKADDAFPGENGAWKCPSHGIAKVHCACTPATRDKRSIVDYLADSTPSYEGGGAGDNWPGEC